MHFETLLAESPAVYKILYNLKTSVCSDASVLSDWISNLSYGSSATKPTISVIAPPPNPINKVSRVALFFDNCLIISLTVLKFLEISGNS